MAKIVIATFGSLGDIHPKIALALELKRRGHDVLFAAMENYREKFELLGIDFHPMRPNIDPEDRELTREMMDPVKGSEKVLKELIFGNIRPMYDDLMDAVSGADVLITGEIVYAAKSVVEKTGIKWVTTSLAPVSLFSVYDPSVPPVAPWFENLRPLGPAFHRAFYRFVFWMFRSWYEPYKEFRRSLGLDENHDPIFRGKYSDLLHLVMFSSALAKPQPDWPKQAIQTGFCFYDGQNDLGTMPEGLEEFLDNGEPPIIFTLGSAAVMDARDFFEQSIEAAKILKKRAVVLYGTFNQPPAGLSDNIVGFDYAPYSRVFPCAACVVHQGGVGTTAQVLRAGVSMLVMPYGHDQPDNAARCRRLGVGRIIQRDSYNANNAARELSEILADDNYRQNAEKVKAVVDSEDGLKTACDAIEKVLK